MERHVVKRGSDTRRRKSFKHLPADLQAWHYEGVHLRTAGTMRRNNDVHDQRKVGEYVMLREDHSPSLN
jgi:hypothetical protein